VAGLCEAGSSAPAGKKCALALRCRSRLSPLQCALSVASAGHARRKAAALAVHSLSIRKPSAVRAAALAFPAYREPPRFPGLASASGRPPVSFVVRGIGRLPLFKRVLVLVWSKKKRLCGPSRSATANSQTRGLAGPQNLAVFCFGLVRYAYKHWHWETTRGAISDQRPAQMHSLMPWRWR
jgi:hypothetical protein